MRRLAILFSVVVFPLAVVARAQAPATFRVGLKDIAIPAPSTELAETGSDYRVLLEFLAPTTNRLVAAFLLPDELEKLRTSSTALSRYALVEVPRRAEFADVTPEQFKQIDASLGQQLGAMTESAVKDQQDELNRRLKALGSGSPVTMDKPVMLGSLFSKPDASGYGEVMALSTNETSRKMAACITLFRVRQRVLFFYFYTPYKDEDTIKSLRTTSEQWVDAILAANK